jgi:hypothetical protein
MPTSRPVVPLAAVAFACETAGVGDPCGLEDEHESRYSGFSMDEVNAESKSLECATRICLANHFQGRVGCPRGCADAPEDERCAGE